MQEQRQRHRRVGAQQAQIQLWDRSMSFCFFYFLIYFAGEHLVVWVNPH